MSELVPRPGVMLDLATVVGRCGTVEESVDRLLDAPRRVLAHEIDFFARARGEIPAGFRLFAGVPEQGSAQVVWR